MALVLKQSKKIITYSSEIFVFPENAEISNAAFEIFPGDFSLGTYCTKSLPKARRSACDSMWASGRARRR